MRQLAFILCLFVAGAAFAQEKPTAVFVFVTNPGFSHGKESGTSWDGAFGIALQRMFTPRFSGELTVSRERDVGGYTIFGPNGEVIESRRAVNYSTPVDLAALYHFRTDGSWKPYAGLGARWDDSRTFADLTGGVVWQFRPAVGLRFDLKAAIGGESPAGDSLNGSVGLAWRI